MPKFFIEANQMQENKITLSNSDMHHIKNVMRMKENDKVEVVYDKKTYLCNLDNNLELHIDTVINEDKELPKEIIAIIGLVKEQKMDLVLQKLTELGVSKIIPVNMERSIVKLDTKKEDKKLIRWNTICKEASEQSHRTNIPLIKGLYKLKDLENEEGLKIVCSTKLAKSFKNTLKNDFNCGKINIVVGPEGGLDPKEEEKLVSFGYLRTSLGPTILRAETAPLCVLSYINYEFME